MNKPEAFDSIEEIMNNEKLSNNSKLTAINTIIKKVNPQYTSNSNCNLCDGRGQIVHTTNYSFSIIPCKCLKIDYEIQDSN